MRKFILSVNVFFPEMHVLEQEIKSDYTFIFKQIFLPFYQKVFCMII